MVDQSKHQTSTTDPRSLIASLASLKESERQAILDELTDEEAEALWYDWKAWARPEQVPPDNADWKNWLFLAGRGAGKTRSAAEVVRSWAEQGITPLALVGPTAADVRDVMVEGESGILAISPPWFMPDYEPSKRRLTWPNGVRASLFSAEEPSRLRGPQFAKAWCDEICAWVKMQETWDMLMFGLRLGIRPQAIITTTPRPVPLLRKLMKDKKTYMTRAGTRSNYANLAPDFIEEIEERYAGTRLGRQELDGEVLDDTPGALWTHSMFKHVLESEVPELVEICVAVDPSGSDGTGGDSQGIVAAGKSAAGDYYVLRDASCRERPLKWGKRVADLHDDLLADYIVAEINYGGAMVEDTIKGIREDLIVKVVTASRGKVIRAQPISAKYEQGKVYHVVAERKEGEPPSHFMYDGLKELEDQMVQMTSEGYTGEGSPDRVDAAVWAISALMGSTDGGANFRIR